MFLGLDLGTTNVKAVVVDRDGRVAADGSSQIDRFQRADGGIDQDIDQIWDAACRAIRQATEPKKGPGLICAKHPPGRSGKLNLVPFSAAARRIEAVGISSQGGALQLLDACDKPIGRVISWLDARGKPFDRRFIEEVGEEFLIEHIGSNTSTMTIGQLLRLADQSPELLALPNRLGFVGDVIVGRLCGRRMHDATSLSIGMLYNPSLGTADPELLGRLGICPEQLPQLAPVTAAAGELLPEAAEATGLTPGIPVSPAVHDQYAASTGAGSVAPGDVCFGTGTAWVLLANTDRLAPPVTRNTFVCPHLVDGVFGQLLSMANGGSAVEWITGLVCGKRPSPEELDARLAAVPAGSEGLRCRPLLMTGSGRFEGIGLAHSANHLIRAVVEGLACELARHLALFTEAGLPVERLVMCGPAAGSRVTPGIVANATDRPVTCVGQSAVSAFGAATIARAVVEGPDSLARLARELAPAMWSVEPG